MANNKLKKLEPNERIIPVINNTKSTWIEDHFDYVNWRLIPISQNDLLVLGKRIVELARDTEKELLLLSEIYEELGLRTRSILEWKKREPKLADDIEVAKTILANRRFRGAVIRDKETKQFKYDGARIATPFGHFNHPELKEQWREDQDFLKSLKTQEPGACTFTVIRAAIPDTGIKPHPSMMTQQIKAQTKSKKKNT